MKFRKANFVIQNIPGAPAPVDVVCGWVEESNTFGFHKYRNDWRATDLMSGTLVTTQSTRKACADWIIENIKEIERIKSTSGYYKKIEGLRQKIKAELKKF